jgi:hypothetical protein
MSMNIVQAADFDIPASWLVGLFSKGIIRCGHCSCTFKAKIPFIDEPVLPCPHCNVLNKLSVVKVDKDGDNTVETSSDYDYGYEYE